MSSRDRTKRSYNQRVRAERARQTRARILAATREQLPEADQMRVEEIATSAEVSVQTLYSHFGSKGGLLVAMFEEVMEDAGLYAGFGRVWASRDGETALRAMVEAALGFWADAWPLIEFCLRVRRTDRELGARIDGFDASRLQDMRVICVRLAEEGRLREGLTAEDAARLAFALTSPYIHEALVIQAGTPAEVARRQVADLVTRNLVRVDTQPVREGRSVDWSRYREASARRAASASNESEPHLAG
jgi:AcrR family transcriptional regulator